MAHDRHPSPVAQSRPRLACQLLAGYLSFCLALSSIIGISPELHRLIEHAGLGAPHVHSHAYRHSHPHSHPHAHHPSDPVAPAPFASPSDPHSDPDSDSSDRSSNHHHHSLAQLLADGLAAPAFLIAVSAPERPPATDLLVIPIRIPIPVRWDALSASRAPPV